MRYTGQFTQRGIKGKHGFETEFVVDEEQYAVKVPEELRGIGVNGIYVMTGIPHGDRPVCITGAEMMKQIVLMNQIILGSVNASTTHFAQAIDDLQKAKAKWGNLVDYIITARLGYT